MKFINLLLCFQYLKSILEFSDIFFIASSKDSRSMLLGLSFVDQIIHSLKGEMWVSGSNFLIILPEAT